MEHTVLDMVVELPRGTGKTGNRLYEMPSLISGSGRPCTQFHPGGRRRHFCFLAMSVSITCNYCGGSFECSPSEAEDRKYCSMDCLYEARKSRNRVVRTCNYCGKEFEVVKSRIKHGRGKHCSKECQYKSIKERGPRSEYTVCECLNCGKEFNVRLSEFKGKNGVGKYCSRECRDEHWKGENHPQYRGERPDNYAGPHWQSIRREVRNQNDYTCQKCGANGKEVHHIKPRRFFDSPSDSNFKDNLLLLCQSCHRKADAAIQRLEKALDVSELTVEKIKRLTIESPLEPTLFNQRR